MFMFFGVDTTGMVCRRDPIPSVEEEMSELEGGKKRMDMDGKVQARESGGGQRERERFREVLRLSRFTSTQGWSYTTP